MRTLATLLALVSLTAAVRADDCANAVQTAFEKQRAQKGYRLLSKQQADGNVVETERDYLAPDRMYNKIIVPGEPAPLETIAIGRWAWGNQGGGWEELQPQFAQSVTYEVTATLQTPVAVNDAFTCLGPVTRDGRNLIGYRSAPRSAEVKEGQPQLARTVLVDPATGLPAYNLVGEVKPDAAPIMVTAYDYPTDISIEAPAAKPARLPN